MEKIYKIMRHAGAWNIALGITIMVIGLGAGIISVINGGILLNRKNDITF